MNKEYKNLVEKILKTGNDKFDASRSANTKSLPYCMLEYKMDKFPLLTTKKISIDNIISELIWFINGDTDIRSLWKHKNYIWDKDYWNFVKKRYPKILEIHNIDTLKDIKDNQEKLFFILGSEFFSLGKIYGYQWRKGKDALASRIYNMIQNPMDRGHVMIAWNEDDSSDMALRPCHIGFKIVTNEDKEGNIYFDLIWYQRSVDVGLGLPYNIASYALLGKIIEKLTNYKFNNLVGFLTDVHIYEPHIPKMEELIERDEELYPLPTLDIKNIDNFETKEELISLLDKLSVDIIELKNYKSYPFLKMDMLALD